MLDAPSGRAAGGETRILGLCASLSSGPVSPSERYFPRKIGTLGITWRSPGDPQLNPPPIAADLTPEQVLYLLVAAGS